MALSLRLLLAFVLHAALACLALCHSALALFALFGLNRLGGRTSFCFSGVDGGAVWGRPPPKQKKRYSTRAVLSDRLGGGALRRGVPESKHLVTR